MVSSLGKRDSSFDSTDYSLNTSIFKEYDINVEKSEKSGASIGLVTSSEKKLKKSNSMSQLRTQVLKKKTLVNKELASGQPGGKNLEFMMI